MRTRYVIRKKSMTASHALHDTAWQTKQFQQLVWLLKDTVSNVLKNTIIAIRQTQELSSAVPAELCKHPVSAA